jgi:hypothetical protein
MCSSLRNCLSIGFQKEKPGGIAKNKDKTMDSSLSGLWFSFKKGFRRSRCTEFYRFATCFSLTDSIGSLM